MFEIIREKLGKQKVFQKIEINRETKNQERKNGQRELKAKVITNKKHHKSYTYIYVSCGLTNDL